MVSVVVGVIENSTKRLIHAAWHGPNNAGMNLARRLEMHLVGIQPEANGEGHTEPEVWRH
jgi:hypothetical protein